MTTPPIPTNAIVRIHAWRSRLTHTWEDTLTWYRRPWRQSVWGIHGTQYIIEYAAQLYLIEIQDGAWAVQLAPPVDSVETAKAVARMREVMT